LPSGAANLEMTEKAPDIKLKRFRASNELMKFPQASHQCKARHAPAQSSIQQTAVPGGAGLRMVETHA
jgi:hypothetical protein